MVIKKKQFLKIAAKHANNPMLNDIKFLYMNNEIKTIRGVESNLNKPPKLKKDGTPYKGTIKRLANIKNKVEEVFETKEVVTKELIDDVFSTANTPTKALSIISIARDAKRQNLKHLLNSTNFDLK